MKYVSMFSGIEAATVAWKPLGWQPVAFSEIEPFPCAVLKHHYPTVPNLGDMTKVDWNDYHHTANIVVGGSPCQSFSIAGLRKALDDPRGQLMPAYFRACQQIDPEWIVWENVPGAFSSGTPKGEDFRIVLEEMVRIKSNTISIPRPEFGRWEPAGRILLGTDFSLAWRVLDTQYWPGTPQRRRRIFLVADFGGTTAPQILFEQESLSGHSAQSI